MGNLLRYIIARMYVHSRRVPRTLLSGSLFVILSFRPQTTFCGYSVPHPAEDEIHLRIETDGRATPAELLSQALDAVVDMAQHLEDEFQAALGRSDYEFVPSHDL